MAPLSLEQRHDWLCKRHHLLLADYAARGELIEELKQQIIQLTHGQPDTKFTSTTIDWSGKHE